ncbi:MAG: hypothetical protein HKN79_03670 [Flavobacteriales bacterium]|nr:hypothetical protein [Flavobacteriales bacterium]
MEIYSEYSFWWLIPCLIISFGLAYLLYSRSEKEKGFSKGLRYTLTALRTLVLAGLMFLLLGPFFKYIERQVQDPLILIVQDNSSSVILAPDSAFYQGEYITQLGRLASNLEESYEVLAYRFDSEITNGLDIDFQGNRSDIGSTLTSLQERHINRNVGAIILATDGIYNRGSSPMNVASAAGLPIYTVAMGDTTIKRDLLIENIVQNRLAYLGNDFPVEVMIRADKLKDRTATLRIARQGEVLFTRSITIDDEDFVTTVPAVLNASSTGRIRYDVSLSVQPDEFIQENNFRSFYMDVLDSRQKILLRFAAPHPDIAAIRQAIESNENYEVVLESTARASGDLKEYDLVITHGIPQRKTGGAEIIDRCREANVPLWVIAGLQTDWSTLRNSGLGVDVQLKGGDNTTDASPSFERDFRLFDLSGELEEALSEWAPLQTSFAEFSVDNAAKALLSQRIGIVDTEQPLWFFKETDGHRSSVLLGEGLWRWRLQDHVSRDGHDRFNELIGKAVQYLAAKEDRRQFRVYAEERFDEDDPIIQEAELYNASYVPINDPEVTVTFTDEEGNTYEFLFNRTQAGYYLDAGRLPNGTYNYTALVSLEGETYRSSGSLTVEAIQVEAVRTQADHRLLYRMAQSTGAEMFYPNELDALEEALLNKEGIVPVIYTTEQMTDLIESRWLFFLLVLFLAIEWFVRKYKGGY